MPTRINRSIIGWAALAVLNCAVITPWLASVFRPPIVDFGAFYTAATVYRHNPGRALYDLRLQLRAEQEICAADARALKCSLAFNHLPYELVLWLPMLALPYRVALWVWRLESVCLLAVAAWLFAKTLSSEYTGKEIFLIALAFFPVPWCLLWGDR